MTETMLAIDELVDRETLEALDGRELAELFQQLEQLRRRTEGALAAVIGAVFERGVHACDGHSNVNGWCRAMGRWSDVECRDRIRTANLIASCDRFRDAVRSGDIGVAQAHELGRAFANARCGSQLVDVAKVMVDNATKLSHHEFRITVRRWEMLTGNAREAVLLQSSRCVVAGCAAPIRRCQADHLTEWNRHGLTDGHNGAPVCGRHNRLKNSGYRVHRDDDGFWHTYRPDDTEIH